MVDVSLAIRTLREHLEQTQPEFAKLLGVSLRTLARYENEVAPTKWPILAKLGKMASDANRPDLLEIFVQGHQEPDVVEVASAANAAWLRGLQMILTHPHPDIIAVVDEIQNKTCYALRRLKNAGLDLEESEQDALNAALEECEAAVAKRDRNRRVAERIYELFNRDAETARPFEDLWNSILGIDEFLGVQMTFATLLAEAIKDPEERNSGTATVSIERIDKISNVVTLPNWPDLRAKIAGHFKLKEQ